MTVDGKQPKETSKTKSSVNLLSTATNISPTESEDMSSYTNTDGASQIASSCDDGKPVPSEPKLDEAKYLLYVAKYDCSTTEDTCLNFKKGDLFYVLSTDEEGWWFAKAKNSGQEGYIPNNFVAKVNTLDAEE